MTFIIGGTISAGLLFSKFLLFINMHSMALRYLFSLTFSYLVFLALIRLWLFYIFGYRHKPDKIENATDAIDTIDLFSNLNFKPEVSSNWNGGGGEFSGGGATGSWGSGDSKVGLGNLDVGDEGGALIIGLLLVLAILAAVGCSFYLIIEAPVFLGEIAIEMAMSYGLMRRLKKDQGNWLFQVFKKTWWAFLILALLVMSFGHFSQKHYPQVRTVSEVWTKIKGN